MRHFHAVARGYADMTRLLLKLDADKEAKQASGATPLLVAAGSNHASVVRELLNDGVNVDACDREGWSAVHLACHKGSVEVMQILLDPQYRVNKDATCKYGKTALHYLAEGAKADASVEMAIILLEHGANTEIRDFSDIGRTPLYIAVKRRKPEFVSLLVRYGAVIDSSYLPLSYGSQEIRNLVDAAEYLSSGPVRRDSASSSKTSRSIFSLRAAFRIKSERGGRKGLIE